MHAAIADKRDELIAICRRYDVARLEVFGSGARGTDFDPERSDADFFVEFKSESKLNKFSRYFDMLHALEDSLGRPVDLVRLKHQNMGYMKSQPMSMSIYYSALPIGGQLLSMFGTQHNPRSHNGELM